MFDFITVTDRELLIFLGILIALNCLMGFILTWMNVGRAIKGPWKQPPSPKQFDDQLKKRGMR